MTDTKKKIDLLMDSLARGELREFIDAAQDDELRDYLFETVNGLYVAMGYIQRYYVETEKLEGIVEERCTELDDIITECDELQAALDERDVTVAGLRNQLQQLRKTNQRMALAYAVFDATIQGLKV